MVEEQKTASVTPSQYQHAGFGVRLVAAIIDGILIGIVTGIVNSIFSTVLGLGTSAMYSDTMSDEAAAGLIATIMGGSLLMIGINMLISWGYYVGMTGYKGATLGKMLMKLEVVDENYQKITFGKAALREIIGKFVSSFVLCLGYLWVLFDDKKQGWHDKIAKTYVIKKS